MKGNTDEYLSLKEIANSALLDLGESAHRAEQFFHWAVDYYKRYRMDIAREVKITQLDMTAWKSINLPHDCVDWIRLGVINGEQVDTFTNTKFLRPRDCACDTVEPQEAKYKPEDGSEGIQYYNMTIYGEDPGKMFGLVVKDNGLGYYSPNQTQRVNEIQLSAKIKSGTKIWLMYLGTLFDPSVDNVVHPYAQFMIRAGVHYENLLNRRRAGNRNISPTDIAMAKNILDEEVCKLAERRFDLRYEDIMEIYRSGQRQTPKW